MVNSLLTNLKYWLDESSCVQAAKRQRQYSSSTGVELFSAAGKRIRRIARVLALKAA